MAFSEAGITAQEQLLADKIAVPLLPHAEVMALKVDYYLQYNPDGLSLHCTDPDMRSAVSVDFSDARLNYRVNSSSLNQNIAKAIGVKGAIKPRVLDATAGLGKDAYLLASLGCKVQMLEKSPIVHALLEDGLRRAIAGSENLAVTAKRMTLREVDLLDTVTSSEPFDVVYLDPMFPARNKSARVKKDMYLLQKLLGHEEGDTGLLYAATQIARKRVVVKRGKLSPSLTSLKPDIEFKGSSSRYDVYLIH